MKLFSRYSLVNLAANVLIFIVASIAFYISLRIVLVNQIDEDLEIEEAEIKAHVRKHDRLPESFSASDQIIRFIPATRNSNRQFLTVSLNDSADEKVHDYRRLIFSIIASGEAYRAEVSKSLESTNKLLYSILLVSVLTILLILSVSALLNRYLLKRLWKPFYASLDAIRKFRVSSRETLSLKSNNIEEFTFMNRTVEHLAHTSQVEYVALKTFSENASHEIQTPIAIIRSKLDLLLQEESLSEKGSKTLQAAFDCLERLSRLNRSLLLLAKIENNQFDDLHTVDLAQSLTNKLEDFNELWGARNFAVETSVQNATVRMNKELSEVLLNNLLSNATLHNRPNGKIEVELNANYLSVKNTGSNSPLDDDRLFQRFYKPAVSGAQNGLGLSIIKQVCDTSGFQILYDHRDGTHQFRIIFI
jgi:signal transduction histidine kinase